MHSRNKLTSLQCSVDNGVPQLSQSKSGPIDYIMPQRYVLLSLCIIQKGNKGTYIYKQSILKVPTHHPSQWKLKKISVFSRMLLMLSLHPAVFLVPFAYHIVTYNRIVNMRIDKTRDWIVIFMFHFRKRVTVFGFFLLLIVLFICIRRD